MNDNPDLNPDLDLMNAVSPHRTQLLQDAIQQNYDIIASHHIELHESAAVCYERLVEPVIEAMGFGKEHRREELEEPMRVILTSRKQDAAMLIIRALGDDYYDTDCIRHIRQETSFQQRIILTDGYNWIVQHASHEIPLTTFTIDQPSAFWDLFMFGHANDL